MDNCGWIKLHRKILEWEWFTDATTLKLFIYMLFMASYKEYKRMGQTYPAGSFICLRESLEACGLTPKQVRHSLEKLKGTGEITTRTLGNATLFTIVKWSDYQMTAPSNETGSVGPNQTGTIGPDQNTPQDIDIQLDNQADTRADGQTKGQTDGQTDGHSHFIEEGKNKTNTNQAHAHTRVMVCPLPPPMPQGQTQYIRPFPTSPKEVIDNAVRQGIAMTEAEAGDFFSYYSSIGWTVNGNVIRNWTYLLGRWHEKQKEIDRRKNNNGYDNGRGGFDRKHVASPDEFGAGDSF